LNRRARAGKIVVLGLGNLLMTDDGAGVRALRAFAPRAPKGVLAAEAGTAILRAEHLIEQALYLLAFDAIAAGVAPGTLHAMRLEDSARLTRKDSLHDLTLAAILEGLAQRPLETVIIGAEPGIVELGLELSPPVAAAVPRMVDIALRIVANWREGGSAMELLGRLEVLCA
jgi:hydrogenase maturation protease